MIELYTLDVVWFITLQNPVDPSESCPGPNWDITQYRISFWTVSLTSTKNVNTEDVSITRCTGGRCTHTFEPHSNSLSRYDNVSIAAENVVGVGPARLCTTQTISEFKAIFSTRVKW